MGDSRMSVSSLAATGSLAAIQKPAKRARADGNRDGTARRMHRHAARNTRRCVQRKCPHDGTADVRLYFDENLPSGFNRYQHGRADGGQHLPSEIDIDDGTAYHDHQPLATACPDCPSV